MKLRICCFIFIICLLISNVSFANTSDIQADPVFSVARALLSTYKTLSVELQTYNYSSYIQINTCQLQYNNGSSWITLSTAVPMPTIIISNHYLCTAGGDYSSIIGEGQYRFKLQIEADEYTKTIYSTANTFST